MRLGLPYRRLWLVMLALMLLQAFVVEISRAGEESHARISPATEREELNRPSPDGRFVRYTLPADTALQILLQTPLDTEINQVGDPVEGVMTRNLYLGNELLLSKNTRFKGTVARAEPAVQGRDAILAVRFTDILLDNGERLPLTAYVRTEHPEHIWGGETTPGTKPMRSMQRVMGIGEYNRLVFGGPRAMGKPIQFSPGEHWTIILEKPLVLVKEVANPQGGL